MRHEAITMLEGNKWKQCEGSVWCRGKSWGRRRAPGFQEQYGGGAEDSPSVVVKHVKKLSQIGDESRSKGERRRRLEMNHGKI